MTIPVSGLDVSNWSGDITQLLQTWHPFHVVVRLSTESQQHRDIARQQFEAALWDGATVSGYVWCDWSVSPEERTADALSVATGFPLTMVWFDAEEGNPGGQVDDWLSRAVNLAERRGNRAGVYCNAGWWRAQGDSQGFARLPLWLASWDNQPTLAGLDLPGGWTAAAGHQYQGDPDLSVFDEGVATLADPCQKLRADLAAMLARKPWKAPTKKQLKALIS